ncbi:MAG TPA: YicC/YloC family endoribonuclease [Vicinamibacterales bacterium]|nr:YicC/YloC family endoribonuclease [Vicinamibacterales bacterium]
MIRSMTGFAAVTHESPDARAHVTVKSVNHRFLDVAIKAPAALSALDSRVKALVQQRLARGRVEIGITLEYTATPAREVRLDEALLAQVAGALDGAREKGLVAGALTPADVFRIPQILEIRAVAADPSGTVPDGLAALVDEALAAAVDALVVMRATEGRFLAADLDGRLVTLTGQVDTLTRLAREGQAALEARLRDRIDGLPADLRSDPAALAQEVVRFVARSDVDEEVTRLRGHLEHWRGLADADEPCGRKLDFLVQEMNREINTIGSKAEGAGTAETVIAAKAELERIREQVQNVE